MNILNAKKIPLTQMILALSTACMFNSVIQLPASASESVALVNQINQVIRYCTAKDYTDAIALRTRRL